MVRIILTPEHTDIRLSIPETDTGKLLKLPFLPCSQYDISYPEHIGFQIY
ncbi:MAG: hypothetical protein LBD52_09350 [Prevotellaceae bacterium]|jgi:hypothetical protein|nr:hypothetical protein [Prevotellaceae bacterium]